MSHAAALACPPAPPARPRSRATAAVTWLDAEQPLPGLAARALAAVLVSGLAWGLAWSLAALLGG